MTTRNFKAAAHRSQGWWALEVAGDSLPHPAYTQARRLDQAEGMVRDLLALHFGVGKDEVGHIEIVPVLDAALAEEVTQTRQAREQAEKVRAEVPMASVLRVTWERREVRKRMTPTYPMVSSTSPS